jgi:hypothetical protein
MKRQTHINKIVFNVVVAYAVQGACFAADTFLEKTWKRESGLPKINQRANTSIVVKTSHDKQPAVLSSSQKILGSDLILPLVASGKQVGSMTLKQGRIVTIVSETHNEVVISLGSMKVTIPKNNIVFAQPS